MLKPSFMDTFFLNRHSAGQEKSLQYLISSQHVLWSDASKAEANCRNFHPTGQV
jgi:hypothetical protein